MKQKFKKKKRNYGFKKKFQVIFDHLFLLRNLVIDIKKFNLLTQMDRKILKNWKNAKWINREMFEKLLDLFEQSELVYQISEKIKEQKRIAESTQDQISKIRY